VILADFSNIYFISLHASYDLKANPDRNFNEKSIRTLVLQMIGSINQKFKSKYGKLVIACDSKQLWRKEVFPPYKAHRKGDRTKLTHIDWPAAFKVFDSLKEELKAYTPYYVIEVDGAEGDDVISTLAREFAGENNILVSTDKDFKQLQAYTKITQFGPIDWKMIPADDAFTYLQNHIITGDRGDGVPNIMSDDDTFIVDGKRQKRLTAGYLEQFLNKDMDHWDNERHRINWRRNKQLIDLRETPKYIQDEIVQSFYQQQKDVKIGKFFDYFSKYRLTSLMSKINDFKEVQVA
jgi:hypothetical protein